MAITAKDVAKKVGLSRSTCSIILMPSFDVKKFTYPQKTVDLVLKTAKEMGYDPKLALGTRPISCNVERMKQLRLEGLSNKEISEREGVCVATVIHRIGYQPKELTLANQRVGARAREARLANRRAQKMRFIAEAKVTVQKWNDLRKQEREYVERQESIKNQMAELAMQMDALRFENIDLVKNAAAVTNSLNAMRKEAESAAKIAGVTLK